MAGWGRGGGKSHTKEKIDASWHVRSPNQCALCVCVCVCVCVCADGRVTQGKANFEHPVCWSVRPRSLFIDKSMRPSIYRLGSRPVNSLHSVICASQCLRWLVDHGESIIRCVNHLCPRWMCQNDALAGSSDGRLCTLRLYRRHEQGNRVQ